MARKHRGQPLLDSPLSDIGLISFLLPAPSQAKKLAASDDELDSETEEILRDATLLLIRLFYAQTHMHLDSMNQELELLVNAPPSPPYDPHKPENTRTKDPDSDMWKIEVPRASVGSSGPLLDASGKV